MSLTRAQMLREMGLGPVWRLRQAAAGAADALPAASESGAPAAAVPPPAASVSADPPVAAVPSVQPLPTAAGLDWEQLTTAIMECRRCVLCERRKQAVPGVGDRNADWLFVGEGPGAEEDERGEPFVGQAGKLLDSMIAAIGLKRGEDVYIANAVKCRPPNNRTPEIEETAACWPYLERQIELIRPKLIVALGRPAAQTLLQAEIKISAARGQLHDYRGIPVIITYHPAYLLRNLLDKAKAWEDLCFMRATMRTLKEGHRGGSGT